MYNYLRLLFATLLLGMSGWAGAQNVPTKLSVTVVNRLPFQVAEQGALPLAYLYVPPLPYSPLSISGYANSSTTFSLDMSRGGGATAPNNLPRITYGTILWGQYGGCIFYYTTFMNGQACPVIAPQVVGDYVYTKCTVESAVLNGDTCLMQFSIGTQ